VENRRGFLGFLLYLFPPHSDYIGTGVEKLWNL